MDNPGCLCCSTKDVEYLPTMCLIEGCLDYLYIIHLVRSESVWNSSRLCSISSKRSSSCRCNSSSRSGSRSTKTRTKTNTKNEHTRPRDRSTRGQWKLCAHPPFLGLHACNKMDAWPMDRPVLLHARACLIPCKNKIAWKGDI